MRPDRKQQNAREDAIPHATTIVMVDLIAGTKVYTDTYRGAPPILVINTGAVEVHLTIAGDRPTIRDVEAIDGVLEAAAAYRASLLGQLD